MNVIFASPAATGKTFNKEALADHFGCLYVVEAEDLNRMSPAATRRYAENTLILCQHPREVEENPYFRKVSILDRDQMNRAMVSIGAVPIWNDDGSVNLMGKRKGLGE